MRKNEKAKKKGKENEINGEYLCKSHLCPKKNLTVNFFFHHCYSTLARILNSPHQILNYSPPLNIINIIEPKPHSDTPQCMLHINIIIATAILFFLLFCSNSKKEHGNLPLIRVKTYTSVSIINLFALLIKLFLLFCCLLDFFLSCISPARQFTNYRFINMIL